ncbi:MAG: hypothetical protein MUF45_16895 [Spirosomaceae bacterium]|jgi:hypothetical protein|nr:hypothetical protein [Spirosomataceae bacterium]
MKKLFSTILFSVILLASYLATADQTKKRTELEKVKIKFKNNSILPRKYTFVLYWNDDASNNATIGVVLAPYATKEIVDVVGTELFIADATQVNTVMSGKRVSGKPFWVFKKEDNGKTINLRKD